MLAGRLVLVLLLVAPILGGAVGAPSAPAEVAVPALPQGVPPPGDVTLVDAGGVFSANLLAEEDQRLRVEPIQATVWTTWALEAVGASVGRVPFVAFKDAAGTTFVAGGASTSTVSHVAYQRIAWSDFDLVLFQAIGLSGSDIHVTWVYCQNSRLLGAYHESAKLPLRWSPAAGAPPCHEQLTPPRATDVELTGVDMPYPPLDKRMTFNGTTLRYDGTGPGQILLDGRMQVLLPFETVDCTRSCGGSPGWWESHVLVHDPAAGTVSFAILYAVPGAPDSVRLHYGIRLPSLSTFGGIRYTAEWGAA